MDIAALILSIFRRTGRQRSTPLVTPENPPSDRYAPHDPRLTATSATTLQEIGRSASVVLDTVHESEHSVQEVIQVAELVSDAISSFSHDVSVQVERSEEAGRVVDELTATIKQISAGAQDQANSAQQMSERVSQVAARLEDVVTKADRVVISSSQASTTAKESGAVVLRATEKMRQIRGTVLDSAQRVEQLSQKSQHIGSINQSITQIAQKTNLLALNAAIEAARAGEHGRGFAVVADEVRKLATGAADAAREINELLQQIQAEVGTIVGVMERGRSEVEDGVALADDAGTALQAILNQSEATATDAETISSAAKDIGQASGQLVDSVTLMAAIAEQNMASTEEMFANAEVVRKAVHDVTDIGQRTTEAGHDMYAAMAVIHGVADQLNAQTGQTVAGVKALSTQVKGLLAGKGTK